MTKRNVKVKIQLCHGYSIPGTQRIMKRPRLLSRGRLVVVCNKDNHLLCRWERKSFSEERSDKIKTP
nr:MAG TPA: hypothetical protein [Caudoviricetes sp.]